MESSFSVKNSASGADSAWRPVPLELPNIIPRKKSSRPAISAGNGWTRGSCRPASRIAPRRPFSLVTRTHCPTASGKNRLEIFCSEHFPGETKSGFWKMEEYFPKREMGAKPGYLGAGSQRLEFPEEGSTGGGRPHLLFLRSDCGTSIPRYLSR